MKNGLISASVATSYSTKTFESSILIVFYQLGSTAIGIQTTQGVVLAVEKRLTSPLLDPASVEKILEIDTHLGCAMSGLIADARTLVEKARTEAQVKIALSIQRIMALILSQNHTFAYAEPMSVESCTQAICDYALQFGEEGAPMVCNLFLKK